MTPFCPNLTVLEDGHPITFSIQDAMNYHGPGYPGGVVHGYKVLERALPLLGEDSAVERRGIGIETAFPGPGARDAFELITRAVTGERYQVDLSLAPADVVESPKGRYFFRLTYREKQVEVVIRPGHVRPEFIAMARKPDRTPEDEVQLADLKREMADRLMPLPAADIYDATIL